MAVFVGVCICARKCCPSTIQASGGEGERGKSARVALGGVFSRALRIWTGWYK